MNKWRALSHHFSICLILHQRWKISLFTIINKNNLEKTTRYRTNGKWNPKITIRTYRMNFVENSRFSRSIFIRPEILNIHWYTIIDHWIIGSETTHTSCKWFKSIFHIGATLEVPDRDHWLELRFVNHNLGDNLGCISHPNLHMMQLPHLHHHHHQIDPIDYCLHPSTSTWEKRRPERSYDWSHIFSPSLWYQMKKQKEEQGKNMLNSHRIFFIIRCHPLRKTHCFLDLRQSLCV